MLTTIPVHAGPRPAWLDRTVATGIFALAVVAIVWLYRIEPDARGYDTHVQLGMAPCSWPRTHGMPCPTCGCTTAACLLVHGRPVAALATQPFGAAITLAGLLLAGLAAYCLLRARSFFDVWLQLPRWQSLLVGVLLLLSAWGYKCLVFAPA